MNLLAYFHPSLSAGFDWAIRASAVFAAAIVVNFALRNRSAATRHLIWSTALLGALLLPLVKWSIPGWNLPQATAEKQTVSGTWLAFHDVDGAWNSEVMDLTSSIQSEVTSIGLGTPPSTQDRVENVSAIAGSAAASSILNNPMALVPIVWGVGAAAILSSILFGMLSLWRLRRTSQPLPSNVKHELAQLCRNLRLRRPVVGLTTKARAIPMTWGVLHPIVMLPAESLHWSSERRRMVLLHELAHIQRWDFAIQMLGQVSRAIHWFNPLAWWTLAQLRLEQERACDDFVLNAGECAADYATELVTVTAQRPQPTWDSAVALAIRQFARMEQRLLSILDVTRDRRPLSAFRAATLVGTVAAIISLVSVPRWPVAFADEPQAPAKASPADEKAKAAETEKNAPGQAASESTLANVRELIQKHSSQEIDSKRLTEAAIKGMLESLQDPYSGFLSSEDFREFQRHVEGRVVGIGAQLTLEQNEIVIVTPLPNSPAAKSGLQPRDVVLSVGGTKMTDLKQAVDAIRGPQGSEVKLRVRRAAKELDVTVVRDVVPLTSVKGLYLDEAGKWQHWLDAEAKLAYVQITDFSQRTVADIEQVLTTLQNDGLKGLILDLRGCPGGLLQSSVKVAGLFLKSGTAATIRGRQQPEQKIEVDGTAKFGDLPLLVAVDDSTSSAAEIMAAALQDHQRAVVIGERTLGKGSVQSLIPVSDLGANLKITTAQVYRANGALLHRAAKATEWGVDPNDGFFVPLTPEQRTAFREQRAKRDVLGVLKFSAPTTAEQINTVLADPVLAAGLRSLSAKLKTGECEKTGRPLAEMKAQLAQCDALRQERDQLLQKLKQIEKQL